MRSRLFLAVFPLCVALAAPAFARGTLDSILPGIRASHPGRLSDAEPWTDQDGSVHYRIKWMTPEGRILYFDADTRTGRYSNAGGDNGSAWRNHRDRDDEGAGGENNGGRRNHWNDDGDGDGNGGGGDWRGRDNNNDGGGWHRGGDRGGQGGREGGGSWRGGQGGHDGGGHDGGGRQGGGRGGSGGWQGGGHGGGGHHNGN